MVSLDGSGVSREAHAPFCERLGVRFPRPTRLSFSEDANTVAKDNAPQNLSMLRKIALNIIRADKTDTRKSSLRLKRKGAAWDDGVRERMLGIRSIC